MGNHRAARRGRTLPSPANPGSPKRRADRRRRRAPLSIPGTRFPAVPTVVGVTALLVAGAGTIGLNHGQLPGGLALSSGHDALTGTDAFSFADRTRAPSRDSDRQALQDAVHKKLEAAAEKQSQQRSRELTSLARSAQHRAHQIAENQWVLPTEDFHLTARFGDVSGLWASFHTGLDFAAPTGTPIFAVADGVISSDGYEGAYGNRTVETLDDGTQIWYCHQSEIDVDVGERVHRGETIGHVGTTGNTTGPHVHIEVHPHGGGPVDPFPEFVQHGVTP